MKRVTIRPPRLRTLEDTEGRHATWTELFYDLVFVVAVAAVGGRLLDDPSWSGIGLFAGYFIPIWWAWVSYTFYADRFDTDDFGQRILAIGQMITIALMAASISGDEATSSIAFAASYATTRVILMIMYVRARRHVPITRELITGYLKGFGAEVAIWLISIAVPEPGRYWLWALGLAVSFATPYAMRKVQATVPLDVEHLPERFGLFTILVLGESMAATIIAVSHATWSLTLVVNASLAVSAAAGLWWVYFDNMQGSVVRRVAEKPKAWKPTLWIYAHMPLTASLVVFAIGLEQAVADHISHGEHWLSAGGGALALICMGLISVANERDGASTGETAKARRRFAGAGVAVLLGVIGSSLEGGPGPGWWLAALVVVATWQVGADIYAVESAASNAEAAT